MTQSSIQTHYFHMQIEFPEEKKREEPEGFKSSFKSNCNSFKKEKSSKISEPEELGFSVIFFAGRMFGSISA